MQKMHFRPLSLRGCVVIDFSWLAGTSLCRFCVHWRFLGSAVVAFWVGRQCLQKLGACAGVNIYLKMQLFQSQLIARFNNTRA